MEVTIIGKGAWGSAMHHVIRQNTSQVRIVGRGEMVSSEVVVIAVPTNNIRELAAIISPKQKAFTIINTAKGIENTTHKFPSEIIHELFPHATYYTLIGPGFAEEVRNNNPTLVNLGYHKKTSEIKRIQALIQTDYFRVKPCLSTEILELASALKNIYAISCGLADGLGYQTNTRTLLLSIAIEEIWQLVTKLCLPLSVENIPGTLGDLILTCNSIESRNFQFGKHMATKSVTESLTSVRGVVEGFTSLNSVAFLEKKAEHRLPLLRFVQKIVKEDSPQVVRDNFEAYIKKI